jgi:type IV secretion system protein VirB8
MKDIPEHSAEELIEYVDSGRYFEDARSWYNDKFVMPFVQRTWLIVIAIVAVISFVLVSINISTLLPLVEKVPYIMQVKDADSQYVKIASLEQEDGDAWIAVSSYLVKSYITTWESYRFSDFRGDNLMQRKQRMRRNSARDLFQQYDALLNDSNPRNPIRIYRNEAQRDITFDDLRFMKVDSGSAKVSVDFTATITQLVSGEKQSTKWNAEMIFQLPIIDPESQKGTPLGFLVTAYTVTSLQ